MVCSALGADDGDSGADLTRVLARKLVSGDAVDASVEDIFQQAFQITAQADQLPADAVWERTEPELVLVATLPSGREQAVAALVPCAGHHSRSDQEQATSHRDRGQPCSAGLSC